MKNFKLFSRQGMALFLVMIMLTIIPNLNAYSAMGDYTSTSANLEANEMYDIEEGVDKQNNVLVAAAAIASAYCAGQAVGSVARHVYDWVSGGDNPEPDEQPEEIARLTAMNIEYQAHDFSTFDN